MPCARIVLPLVLLACSASTLAAADWPTWRCDAARSGATPEALPERLYLQWTLHLPTPNAAWPSDQEKLSYDRSYEPIVVGRLLIVASMVRDSVTAYDTRTGHLAWRFYADGPVRLAPAAWEGKLYFTSDDGNLYCLNVANGTLRWRVRGAPSDMHILGNERLISAWPARTGPVVADGVVYFTASIWPFMGTFVYAVDAESGRVIWTNSGTGANYTMQQHGSPAFAGVAPQGYLAVAGDKLIVPGGRTVPAVFRRSDGQLVHFDPSSRLTGKDPGGYVATPVGEGYINGGYFYQLSDGKLIGQAPGDLVASGRRLLGLDKDDLRVVTLPDAAKKSTMPGTKLLWSRPTEMPSEREVRIDLPDEIERLYFAAGERVYGSGAEGRLYAIAIPQKETDRGVVWESSVPGRVWNMLAGDERLFVVNREGWIFCFGAEAAEAHLPGPEEVVALDDEGPFPIVARSAVWKYLASEAEPPADWMNASFSDRKWPTSRAALDEDDTSHKTLTGVPVNSAAADKVGTIYFRRAFVLPDAPFAEVRLRVTSVDGASVWLNGHKLAALAAAPEQAAKAGRKLVLWESELEPQAIKKGANILALAVPKQRFEDPEEAFVLELTAEISPFAPMLAMNEIRFTTAAGEIMRHSGVREGYAVAFGVGDGTIIEELVRDSRLKIVGIDPDAARVAALRARFDAAGLYGERIALFVGDPDDFELPPYFASLVFTAEAPAKVFGGDLGAAHVHAWQRILRPYGGVACVATSDDEHGRFAQAVTEAKLSGVELERDGGYSLLRRSGGMPGAGQWTQQNADVGNTLIAHDDLVRLPLGMLWFGGPSNAKILPRHGHGPVPQVLDGRLFIEGPDILRATDIYTGRLLWEHKLPSLGLYYNNTSHHAGAAAIGGNYACASDGVYVAYGRKCLRLDPATGVLEREFQLPVDAKAKTRAPDEPPYWGYVGILNDLLLATSTPLPPLTSSRWREVSKIDDDRFSESSRRLVVLNRHSGKTLWARDAAFEFRHNAIAAGAQAGMERLFAIDRATAAREKLLPSGSAQPGGQPTLYAFNAQTGAVLWQTSDRITGTWLAYSAEHDVLLQCGSQARDRASDETGRGMVAYRGATGDVLWANDAAYTGPCLVRGDTIITQGDAYSLLTGKALQRNNPLTESPEKWSFTRNYGCNTALGCTNLLTFRSAAAGFFDLAADGGTGNFGGFRSGCTNNLIPAGGILSAPDYTRTCTCSYPNQCSLALAHMPELEYWTFNSYTWNGQPLRRLGINFGAPGDRRADDGTLWLDYPSVGGKSPDVPVKVNVAAPKAAAEKPAASGEATASTATPAANESPYYRYHASLLGSDSRNWIGASGVRGNAEIEITLASGSSTTKPRDYKVRLYFCEIDDCTPGARVFNVNLQGEAVLKDFDICAAAGGPRKVILKEFTTTAGNQLRVSLATRDARSRPPLLSGIEILALP